MRSMSIRMWALILTAFFLPAFARALPLQEPAQAKQEKQIELSVYHVEYTVRELEDGKRLNSRNYTLILSRNPPNRGAHGMIRAGSNVPISLPAQGEKGGSIQYGEVGIKIDCDVTERDKGVGLWTNFESSYVPLGPDGASRIPGLPTIRHVKFASDSSVALEKPTVIGTVDDVMTNRRYEVEATVTKVK